MKRCDWFQKIPHIVSHGLLYNKAGMLHYEAKTKRPTYQYNTHFIGKKETAICFTFVVI